MADRNLVLHAAIGFGLGMVSYYLLSGFTSFDWRVDIRQWSEVQRGFLASFAVAGALLKAIWRAAARD